MCGSNFVAGISVPFSNVGRWRWQATVKINTHSPLFSGYFELALDSKFTTPELNFSRNFQVYKQKHYNVKRYSQMVKQVKFYSEEVQRYKILACGVAVFRIKYKLVLDFCVTVTFILYYWENFFVDDRKDSCKDMIASRRSVLSQRIDEKRRNSFVAATFKFFLDIKLKSSKKF